MGSDTSKSRFVRASKREVDKASGNSSTSQNPEGSPHGRGPPRSGAPPESNNGVEEPVHSGAPSIQAVRMD